MTTEDELDMRLAKPLAPVADNGFSSAVTAKIAAQERAAVWFEWGLAAALCGLVLFFAPWGRLTAPFETVALDLGLSVPFAIACAVLALTQAGLRWFAE